MNKFVISAIIAMLLPCMGYASTSDASRTKSKLLQLDAQWSQAAKARDVDRVVSFWADDATVFPPGSPPITGKAAIRDYVIKSFQTPGFSISWKTTSVVISRSGDLAYATGTNRVTFNGSDGKQITVDGKAVTVWRRDAKGEWKCVIDIWNDVSPPPQ